VTLTGTLSHRTREVEDTEGFVTAHDGWDLLVTAADLVLDSATVLPQRGDTWEQVIGSTTHVYEVLSIPGEDVYDWADPHHVLLRIHMKHKSTS
jgi:hypothetical protein